jgi:hypothetical protein
VSLNDFVSRVFEIDGEHFRHIAVVFNDDHAAW